MAEIELSGLDVRSLLRLHCAIGQELILRKLTRSTNNPVGDYAECLFANALSLSLAGNSAKGYDAVDADGQRYQIKGRRPTLANPSRQLSVIRNLDHKPFEFLAGVVFAPDFAILRAAIIPHHVVISRSKYREHVNGWLFHLEDHVWMADGVRDVTIEICAVEAALNPRTVASPCSPVGEGQAGEPAGVNLVPQEHGFPTLSPSRSMEWTVFTPTTIVAAQTRHIAPRRGRAGKNAAAAKKSRKGKGGPTRRSPATAATPP